MITSHNQNGGRKNGYPPFFTLKTLRRKLYIHSITPPQMITANCCAFLSAMRGTFIDSAIVANDKTASSVIEYDQFRADLFEGPNREKLTNSSNNLRLHSKLIGKTTSKVADTALAIAHDVRDFTNMVEHVATGKQKNSNQAEASPEISVPYNRQNVWRQNSE